MVSGRVRREKAKVVESMGVERVLTYDHEEKERERVEGKEVSSRDIVCYILFVRGVPNGH